MRADDQQPRIEVIFWGKSKRMHPDEKAPWHPDVDVLRQENALVDKTVSVNLVNTKLKPVTAFFYRNFHAKYCVLFRNVSFK